MAVTVLGKVRIDGEQSESAVVYEVVAAENLDEAIAWAEDMRPSERCYHAYDCCGRWYASSASVSPIQSDEGRFLVSQPFYMNV